MSCRCKSGSARAERTAWQAASTDWTTRSVRSSRGACSRSVSRSRYNGSPLRAERWIRPLQVPRPARLPGPRHGGNGLPIDEKQEHGPANPDLVAVREHLFGDWQLIDIRTLPRSVRSRIVGIRRSRLTIAACRRDTRSSAATHTPLPASRPMVNCRREVGRWPSWGPATAIKRAVMQPRSVYHGRAAAITLMVTTIQLIAASPITEECRVILRRNCRDSVANRQSFAGIEVALHGASATHFGERTTGTGVKSCPDSEGSRSHCSPRPRLQSAASPFPRRRRRCRCPAP